MVRNSEKCCVPNCGKTRLGIQDRAGVRLIDALSNPRLCGHLNKFSVSEDNVILHKFPDPVNEPDRFCLWIYAICGDVLALNNQYVHLYRKVCHIHFEQKYATRSDRLSAVAIPTLHLKGMASTEFPTTLRKGETHNDHTYDITRKTNTLPVGELQTREARLFANTKARDAQIDAAPEIEPVPELPEDATFDADDVQAAPSPVPEVENSGGETLFSWQNTELIEADEADEAPAPAPAPPADPTLALVCDSDPDPDPDPDLHPDQAVPSGPVPEDSDVENRCKDCREVNEGFELWCVQCGGGALCGACAARPPHHAHYVLRAPVGATRAVTQAVLTLIRQQLQNENLLSPHETVDDGLKVEVKEEPAENPPVESGPPAEPDPLACEPHEPQQPHEPHSRLSSQEPHSPHSSQEPHSPHSSQEPHSPHSSQEPHSPHSSRESNSPPASPSPDEPDLPDEPHSPPEPATHDADKYIVKKIVNPYEPFSLPLLRKATDHAHKENLILATERKLVKVPPAQVKQAFLSHIERIVTTQQKQLKVYQPPIKHISQNIRENLVTTQHNIGGSTHGGTLTVTTQQEQVRGPQAPVKITSEPEPSETVIIDLDDVADEETIEYLEEGLESDIEILDEHLLDEHEGEVLKDGDLVDEDNLSEEDRIIGDIAGRGVKRKNDAQESLPVRGPSESMVRALPSKALVQMRPLSSLEIRNWTADRKRLRKD